MGTEYGVIGGMLLGLGAIARFIWRWEKTFTDSAIEELKRLRKENEELRDRLMNRDRNDNTKLRQQLMDRDYDD